MEARSSHCGPSPFPAPADLLLRRRLCRVPPLAGGRLPRGPCRDIDLLAHAQLRTLDPHPQDEDGLRAALGETHRRYSQRVNLR